MWADFEALSAIGSIGDGGVNRPSLSTAHLAARNWFASRIHDSGLELRIDSAGNHSAFLACDQPGAKTLLLGSHLDSVPHGGRYDGALGVLAAFEVLRVVKEMGERLLLHLEAIDFTDEEGTLVGELGSLAVAGNLREESLHSPRGGRAALVEGLARAGLSEAGLLAARRDPTSLAGYLELHIEQGKRLLNTSSKIGIVTAIVGITSCRVIFTGQADHAGTTALLDQRNALRGAAHFAIGFWEKLEQDFSRCVGNIGNLQVIPGVFNIVPERVEISVELRAPDISLLTRLEEMVNELSHRMAERFQLGVSVEWLDRAEPVQMDRIFQDVIVNACRDLGFAFQHMASYAGHDAQALASICPVGMIFVPSVGGYSHSPREYTDWQDCVNGANVLLEATLRLARGDLG
jgi:N-carbamoyl-L-amino-acid hydrolase